MMNSHICDQSVAEVLSRVKNKYTKNKHVRPSDVLNFEIGVHHLNGLPIIYPLPVSLDKLNIVDCFGINLSVQPYLCQTLRESWKKQIRDYIWTFKTPIDVPDWCFMGYDTDYNGSKDLFVIYNNYLVKL